MTWQTQWEREREHATDEHLTGGEWLKVDQKYVTYLTRFYKYQTLCSLIPTNHISPRHLTVGTTMTSHVNPQKTKTPSFEKVKNGMRGREGKSAVWL